MKLWVKLVGVVLDALTYLKEKVIKTLLPNECTYEAQWIFFEKLSGNFSKKAQHHMLYISLRCS
jgi:hypothetical protein